jgi:hypothetical protein
MYTCVKYKLYLHCFSRETNDGGAVNDKYLRDFVNSQIESYVSQSEETGSCTAETCTSPSSPGDQYKYQSVSFRLVCYNPALGESMYGLKVIQQITPYRRSELQVCWISYLFGITILLIIDFLKRGDPLQTMKTKRRKMKIADLVLFSLSLRNI